MAEPAFAFAREQSIAEDARNAAGHLVFDKPFVFAHENALDVFGFAQQDRREGAELHRDDGAMGCGKHQKAQWIATISEEMTKTREGARGQGRRVMGARAHRRDGT